MRNVLNRYCSCIERHASLRAAIASLLLLMLAVAGMNTVVRQFVVLTNGTLPLDITFFYGMDVARTFFTHISPEAAHYYLTSVTVADTLFPLVYAVSISFIVAWILAILKRGGIAAPRWLIAYSLIPMMFDYLENAGFVAALCQCREVAETLLFATMAISGLKWLSALVGTLILIWLVYQSVRIFAQGETR